MHFTREQCKHAQLGETRAIRRVPRDRWSDGDFEIEFGANSARETTTHSTTGLLMEAMRLMDEANQTKVEISPSACVCHSYISDSVRRAAFRGDPGPALRERCLQLAGTLSRKGAGGRPRRSGNASFVANDGAAELILTTAAPELGQGFDPRRRRKLQNVAGNPPK